MLFSGTKVPVSIRTDERIFEILTYDDEYVLCNIETAQLLICRQECKGIKHYWNHKFQGISKKEVKEMK